MSVFASEKYVFTMTEVIQLESFKRKQAAIRGFKSWSKRFGEKLDEQTKLSDLSDGALLFLISPGDQNIFALYDLVMGVKNLGTASDFFNLDKPKKMEVIDISIHLLDQLRFECMRRLNWLESGFEQPENAWRILIALSRQTHFSKLEPHFFSSFLKELSQSYNADLALNNFERLAEEILDKDQQRSQ